MIMCSLIQTFKDPSPLLDREGTSKQDETVPLPRLKSVKPGEPNPSPLQVRRSTRTTKCIPPLRYGSVTSHRVSANTKIGKWLSSISKKVDSIYDHMFD